MTARRPLLDSPLRHRSIASKSTPSSPLHMNEEDRPRPEVTQEDLRINWPSGISILRIIQHHVLHAAIIDDLKHRLTLPIGARNQRGDGHQGGYS